MNDSWSVATALQQLQRQAMHLSCPGYFPALPTMALASESPLSAPWSLYLSSWRFLLVQAAVITSHDCAFPYLHFCATRGTVCCPSHPCLDLCRSSVTLLRVTYPQSLCTGKSAV